MILLTISFQDMSQLLVILMPTQWLEQINFKTYLFPEFLEVLYSLFADAEDDFENNPNSYKFQW